MDIVIYLVVAGIAGFVGSRLVGGGGGIVLSVVLGVVGVWLGTWLAGLLGLPGWAVGGVDVVWGIIGAALLIFGIRLLPKAWLLKLGAKS